MGRSENCDVLILDLKSSREHAEIILVGKEYILTDLGSQNGIIINDLKVKQHALTDGDKIIVGKTVYKFSKVDVKEETTIKRVRNKNKLDEENDSFVDEQQSEDAAKNKKMTIGLAVIILFAVILLAGDDTAEKASKQNKGLNVVVKEVDDSFAKAIKQRSIDSKRNQEKLSLYFKKGLREFREGNYFRAISEFENAREWSPTDPLASFYLRKTREKLDEQIELFFSKATRDTDAVNYKKASISYCSIIRLLNRYETDERYLAAKEGVKVLEQKMALEEGEIICVQKVGDDQ
jgi:pSer/pThr/pTyr-binding forkhead associated (FHA) protein